MDYFEGNFDTLMIREDIAGIKYLARCHPERKCSPNVLDWASQYGHTEIVRLLLAAQKECTNYALDYASGKGYTEIVKLLLAAGSPYSDCTDIALDCASMNGHIEVVKLLLAANKPCTTWALN